MNPDKCLNDDKNVTKTSGQIHKKIYVLNSTTRNINIFGNNWINRIYIYAIFLKQLTSLLVLGRKHFWGNNHTKVRFRVWRQFRLFRLFGCLLTTRWRSILGDCRRLQYWNHTLVRGFLAANLGVWVMVTHTWQQLNPHPP